MNRYDVVKIKKNDMFGYITIPSREGDYGLNLVKAEDGSLFALGSDELEVDNDRTEKFNREIENIFK